VNVGFSKEFVLSKFQMFDLDGDGNIDAYEAKNLVLAMMMEMHERYSMHGVVANALTRDDIERYTNPPA
jgi:hypothetical protein